MDTFDPAAPLPRPLVEALTRHPDALLAFDISTDAQKNVWCGIARSTPAPDPDELARGIVRAVSALRAE